MVRPGALRIVLDTNVIVRGLIDDASPSGRILHACETRDLIPILSRPTVSEYRIILAGQALVEAYPQLTAARVNLALRRLIYLGDVVQGLKRFEFPRDPKDAKFIELVIAGNATHLITLDRDLLELPRGRDAAARNFRRRSPGVVVIKPSDFIVRMPSLFV